MTDREKYLAVFTDVFQIDKEAAMAAEYKVTDQWDSVGHLSLIIEIERTFGIEMRSEDIMDLTTFDKGAEILKTYDIDVKTK